MYVTDVGRGLKYSGVQALHDHKDSGRGQSLLTAQKLSMMTPVCWIWKVFALLPLPVMVSSSVLGSSAAFVLHVQDRLMWEHCPLLIHFCREASTRPGWLTRDVGRGRWNATDHSQLWQFFSGSLYSDVTLVFWACRWCKTGLPTAKQLEKPHGLKV